MGIRRLLQNNALRGAVMLGAIGLATTACSGFGVGTFRDSITGNQVTFSIRCTSNNGGTCVGSGRGTIDGKTFTTKSIYLDSSTECPTSHCVGGNASVNGSAIYGGATVDYFARATDADPSPMDTLHLVIYNTPQPPATQVTLTCSNGCFTLVTSANG
jgi:hypothetical protein